MAASPTTRRDRPDRRTLSRLDAGALVREARLIAGLNQGERPSPARPNPRGSPTGSAGDYIPRVDTLGRILQACGFEADLTFRRHDDVDRSQIVRLLDATPDERLDQLENIAVLPRARRVGLTWLPSFGREIFATLAEHRVRYVVIGGLAAVMHGSSAATGDVDICPERSTANLEHLAAACCAISTLAFARPWSPWKSNSRPTRRSSRCWRW